MVVAKNSAGSTASAVWAFTTAADVVVITNSPPTVVSVTPAIGTGSNPTFTLTYSDANGASDINGEALLVNTIVTGLSSCWVVLDNSGNIWLANDDGVGWTYAALSANKPLSNHQCSVTPRTVKVVRSGNNVTVTLPISFTKYFSGIRNLYLYAADQAGANSGYQAKGSWTVP
jgi:hypothetical protein